MIPIVCIDDNGGMMFNHRRQSRDKKLIEWLTQNVSQDIACKQYSEELFGDNVTIVDDLQDVSNTDAYVFVEDDSLEGARFDEIVVCHWNRKYPSDLKLKANFDGMRVNNSWDIEGNSHDKITIEQWIRTE